MSRVRAMASARLRVLMVLGAGLLLGGVGVLAGAVLHSATASAAVPTCTQLGGPGTAVTVTLKGGTVTISQTSAGAFTVSPNSNTDGCKNPFTTSNISFQPDPANATGPSTVVLDQTGPGGQFPCNMTIGGTVGDATVGNATLDVDGAPSENLVVGTGGLSLDSLNSSCNVIDLAGVGGYGLTSVSTQGVFISAAGSTTTGGPTTVPVTMVGGSKTVAASGDIFTLGAGTDVVDVISGTGNSLDFGAVQTSAGTNLAINLSGTSETIGGTTVLNGEAAVGSVINDTFTASAFNSITGSLSGNTDFLGGDVGGVSFTGQGPGGFANIANWNDAADFSAASSGVVVNLSNFTQGGVLNNSVKVASGNFTIVNLTTVTGSSLGSNTFYAGQNQILPSNAALSYNFTGDGNNNTFYGGANPEALFGGGTQLDTFTSNGSSNKFIPGTADATFIDPTSGNTVDLSSPNANVPTITDPAVVDVSGAPDGNTANDTATTSSGGSVTATYDFSGLGSNINFFGSQGGTKFDGGTVPAHFNGFLTPASPNSSSTSTGSWPSRSSNSGLASFPRGSEIGRCWCELAGPSWPAPTRRAFRPARSSSTPTSPTVATAGCDRPDGRPDAGRGRGRPQPAGRRHDPGGAGRPPGHARRHRRPQPRRRRFGLAGCTTGGCAPSPASMVVDRWEEVGKTNDSSENSKMEGKCSGENRVKWTGGNRNEAMEKG